MDYFILTISNTESELDRRLDTKQWPLFEKTKYVRDLKNGDRVVFYQAGSDKHRFVGDAKIDSVTDTSNERKITLSDVSKWKKPVGIKKIYENLEIIKQKEHYGVYLAGGIRKLSQNDFKTITKNAS